MASFTTSQFQLKSTQTAIVLVVPPHLQPEINSLRGIHDKAFGKWDPHISILYPFVEPSSLSSAVAVLQDALRRRNFKGLKISTDEVGLFRHRKNATVFLKPGLESVSSICQLRGAFVYALGCNDRDGTYDGTFRPHLTVGQASLKGTAIEKLIEQVKRLAFPEWESVTLSVLRREASGEMKSVGELKLANSENEDYSSNDEISTDPAWRSCYLFASNNGWNQMPQTSTSSNVKHTIPQEVKVLTYNLMAETGPLVPPFKSRIKLIIQAISSATATSTSSLEVICLQEINDEMLPLLLAEPFIQERYPFSTHRPSSLLPSRRNIVTMASRKFKHFSLQFSERHKTALIVSFDHVSLEVANVHLTSSLSNEAVKSKERQMKILTEFLTRGRHKIGQDVFLTGDFNITTSSCTMETALSRGMINPDTARSVGRIIDPDVWIDIFDISKLAITDYGDAVYAGEKGATFDRLTNHLAALTESPIINRPERYDRVLFRKGENIQLKDFTIFGRPTEQGFCGSDHYGICVVLQIGSVENTPVNTYALDLDIPVTRPDEFEVIEDSTDLQPLIEPYLPTVADRDNREEALALLRETYTSSRNCLANLVFAPLGSYCMDTFFADSDVDLLIIGSINPQLFFDLASARLRALNPNRENSFKGFHLVNSLVTIVEVSVLDIKFDLQYCQAAELVERYHAGLSPNLATLVFDAALISSLPPSAIRPLNTYRDTAYLLNSISDLQSYRISHRFISLYLKNRGLYSAKFGYLGGIHLSLMLNRVIKLIAANYGNGIDPVSDNINDDKGQSAVIVRSFFAYYALFNWAEDNIVDPLLPEHRNVPRSARDSIFIQSIHKPTARPNVASSCTQLSAKTLTAEFGLAAEKLQLGDWQWCLRPREASINDFMKSFGAFIQVQIDMWDVAEMGEDKVREMLGGLESKFPRLMVALGRIDGLDGRVWPGRFQTRDSEGAGKDMETVIHDHQFKGLYIVGVSGRSVDPDAQRRNLFSGKVITAVREFERNVKEAKELEGGNIWVSMEVVSQKKIRDMGLVEDRRDWSRISEPHHGERTESKADELNLDPDQNPTGFTPSLRTHQRSGYNYLRPVQDIISRIHWDPTLPTDGFVIGYEDRFLGVKEIDLARWKTEQTDEEFIPMHRIVWVRNRKLGDGGMVWDRKRKVDLIFGSGVGGGVSRT